MKRVNVAAEYEEVVRSEKLTLSLPSVIVLKNYVVPTKAVPFTRATLFLRDEFTCQYCDTRLPASDLTFDHVVPRSKGGRSRWDNVVAACSPCNLKKANKMPKQCGMHPLVRPQVPTVWQLQENGRAFPPNYLHESWRDYLYWDTELQQDDDESA